MDSSIVSRLWMRLWTISNGFVGQDTGRGAVMVLWDEIRGVEKGVRDERGRRRDKT